MTRPSRFALAKDHLVHDLERVVADVFGANAKPRNRGRTMWKIISPWRAKAKASQTVVWLTGARRGGFKDFVTGETGDAIDLVVWGKEGIVTKDGRLRAVEWTEDRYGLRSLDPATRKKMEAEGEKRRQAIAVAEAESRQKQRDRVRKTFFACDAKILGTPIELYYGRRGVPLSDVPHLTPAFRYRSDLEYWPLAPLDGEGRRLGPGPKFPGQVAAMVSGDGKLGALHLTFLTFDGMKAPVKKLGNDPELNEKLFKGDVAGLVIRATQGPSGLSAELAAAAGVADWCGLTEGIEDALSAAIAEPTLRMWAAGSLSSLLHVPDHACVKGWLVFRDNDWGKPQAAELFDRAMRRLRSFGKPVEEIAMPGDWGKDVNDALENA